MQNLIFLTEPPSDAWNTSSKAGKMCLNRLCIAEDAAFELSGVYCFAKYFFQIYYDYFYNVQKKCFNEKNIDSAFREILTNKTKERKIHFICTVGWSSSDTLRSFILKGMKKCKIRSVMVTFFHMERRNLITKEKMESHCNGGETTKRGEILKNSVNDDLDVFFEDLRLGNEPEERVDTYFLPKLTQEELELMERKDESYRDTFNFPFIYWEDEDVSDSEMKMSESDSKFVRGLGKRKTFTIENLSED